MAATTGPEQAPRVEAANFKLKRSNLDREDAHVVRRMLGRRRADADSAAGVGNMADNTTEEAEEDMYVGALQEALLGLPPS